MIKTRFPFTAIIGQDAMKKALILNVINPKIGGVLINGEKGTGKSTAVRSFANMLGITMTELPLNVTEDRLVGSIDFEKTVKTGRTAVQEGLLKEADGGVMYVDEVNLLQDHIVDILLDVCTSKKNTVEREGISHTHPCDFVLVGTMNMEEGGLRPLFLDRFGLFVNVTGEKNPESRVEIMKRRMAFEKDLKQFGEKFVKEDNELRGHIFQSRGTVKNVVLSDENLRQIVELCIDANIDGHRGDIVMQETAKALAAWNMRNYVTEDDINEAAYFALMHRKKDNREQEQEEHEHEHEPEDDNNQQQESNEEQSEHQGKTQEEQEQEQDNDRQEQEQTKPQPTKPKTKVFEVGKAFKVKTFGAKKDRKARKGAGKRTLVKTSAKSGRYVFSTMNRRNGDLALDATIRAAAPHQRRRKQNGLTVVIKDEDIREKVRQKRMANLLVFIVDASGSMGAGERMVETKGAILSLLKDAYVKRDKVALVVFSGSNAKIVLPPTSSVQRGYKLMEQIETGGRTPLNDGLNKGLQLIKNELKKSPQIMPMMIVITDGRGNVPLINGDKPSAELMEIGDTVAKEKQITPMIIDIEKEGMMQMGLAKELAKHMDCPYFKIETLQSNSMLSMINEIRG